MVKILSSFFDPNKSAFKRAKKIVPLVNALEEDMKKLSDEELKQKTEEFRSRISKGETLDQIMPEAFATVREASRRTTGMRHFDVQIIGGAVLHYGDIAEMKTGEGKTLVATLPLYLNALEGKGAHLVTVNDYLAKLHAVLMGQIYDFLGLSVGVVNHEASFLYDPLHTEKDLERDTEGTHKVVYDFLRPSTRKEAYDADITYGTNQEFGFDYLRDNLSYSKYELRQRGYNFAVVDEIDSILIDEARTPLIISAPTEEAGQFYTQFANIAKMMTKDEDYTVDEKMRAIQITDKGISKAENILGVSNIYTQAGLHFVHHLENAIKAKALFERDKDYVVQDGEIVIVDEFTGRLQPGRRWSEGLHQAIEAKEGVKIKQESKTYASITYQNYFRLYDKLSGMTGTAETSSEEFFTVYGLNTVVIPTNKPSQRKDLNDLIFKNEEGKFKALAKKVKELQEKGQPVLIGTVSVEKNELLSAYLTREGIKHQILNAKNHEREGEIIAEAGAKGSVTVATNMAGRGVDIKLGGANPTKEEYEEVKSLGGLFVIGTERHEARRIDNQLRGRAGRQGDPGETQFYVSLDDTLMRVFAGDVVKSVMDKLKHPEDVPIKNSIITKQLEMAQKKIEGMNFDARKQVLAYDDVLNRQRQSVYEKRRKALLADVSEFIDFLKIEYEIDIEKEIQDSEVADLVVNKARQAYLQIIDWLWVDHLEAMDYLRSSVNLRGYGQRDPLVEYKKEGLRLFKELEMSLAEQVVKIIPNVIEENMQGNKEMQSVSVSAQNLSADKSQGASKKIGRNDPCPCGSGKKYKKCCGKNV